MEETYKGKIITGLSPSNLDELINKPNEFRNMKGTNVNGVNILVPKSFEGILPVSPSLRYFDFEPYTFLGLKLLTAPGDIVFDIGASYGVMTCLLAKLVGEAGKVCSLEANPRVIAKARELVKANSLDNVIFVNKFIGEKSGVTTDFFIIPGSNSVASTRNSDIMKEHPTAVRTRVEMLSIDDFVKVIGLVPDVCKLDIEGAEYLAIKGMCRLLADYAVDLVIETHGLELLNIGGDLEQLLTDLQKIGYSIMDLKTGMIMTEDEFVAHYSEENGYVLLSKKLKNEEFKKTILDKARHELTAIHSRLQGNADCSQIRHMVDNRQFERASVQLEKLLQKRPIDPELNYLMAFCLHTQNKNFEKAVNHYKLALEYGFDEFWVRYHLGSLYAEMGKIDVAGYNLERAKELRPDHQGLQAVLRSL